jgi:hypothetical protein
VSPGLTNRSHAANSETSEALGAEQSTRRRRRCSQRVGGYRRLAHGHARRRPRAPSRSPGVLFGRGRRAGQRCARRLKPTPAAGPGRRAHGRPRLALQSRHWNPFLPPTQGAQR